MDLYSIAKAAEKKAAAQFEKIDEIAYINTEKVLSAFSEYRVSDSIFGGTTGYGYDDVGRDTLEKIYAKVFGGEAALVRLNIVNGSHAIACALMSCLSCGDTLLSVTGAPYDTLQTLVGLRGKIRGTFPDYGINYRQVDLKDGEPDLEKITEEAKTATAVFIQRSRGYGIRRTLSCADIGEIVKAVKKSNPNAPIIVDNCYGEFCETQEPLAVGADLICGSLIKNPGGGLAPAGGYIAGRADLVEGAAFRLTLPGIGGECGATFGQNRHLYQGFFMAPHITAQALKTAVFCAAVMEDLGFDVSPTATQERYDIIQTINFGKPEPLLAFCRGIQEGAPVDSFATPEPWDMPGYDCPVVMAAGAFIQGSSIELSCDAPMREPYTAYMQGGLTYEAGKIGIMKAARRLLEL